MTPASYQAPVSYQEPANRLPQTVLGGERQGDLIAGFDVGNSPQEYTAMSGRTIITTTTNGTLALRACEGARRVLVGALRVSQGGEQLAKIGLADDILVAAAVDKFTLAPEVRRDPVRIEVGSAGIVKGRWAK